MMIDLGSGICRLIDHLFSFFMFYGSFVVFLLFVRLISSVRCTCDFDKCVYLYRQTGTIYKYFIPTPILSLSSRSI